MSTFCYYDGAGDTAVSNLTAGITGDLDVRARIRAADWTPAVTRVIACQYASADGQRGWRLSQIAASTLQLTWTTDGNNATAVLAVSTAGLQAAAGLTDNLSDIWAKATLDVDNDAGGNAVKYWWSSDGNTWTQLGNTVTTAGVTSIFDSGKPLTVGCDTGPSYFWNGRIYKAEIRSGIDGTIVASPDFSASPWDEGETVNVDAQGNTWTLTNAVIRSDQTATLDAAVRTRTAGELTVTPGTCSLTLDPAVRVRTAGDLTISPGVCAVTLDAAHRIRTANDLTIGQGTAAMLHPIRASGRYKQNRARIRIYP